MPYFDSHVHMVKMDALGGFEQVIARAVDADVARMIAVGGSPLLNRRAIDAARECPEQVRLAIGFDRDQADEFGIDAEASGQAARRLNEQVDRLSREGIEVCALGEMGLDYHYSPDSAPQQKALFKAQLAASRRLALPVIIHSRNADEDTLTLLRDHVAAWTGDPKRVGVLHCFTGSQPMANALLELGLYISFSGIVTFRNADPLREVAMSIPDEQLLIETDSPYLAPVPVRGRQNEPIYVKHVAACLADVRDTSVETVAESTFRNACRLFGINDQLVLRSS